MAYMILAPLYSISHKKMVFRVFHLRETEILWKCSKKFWKCLLNISVLFWWRIKNFLVFKFLCFSDKDLWWEIQLISGLNVGFFLLEKKLTFWPEKNPNFCFSLQTVILKFSGIFSISYSYRNIQKWNRKWPKKT